ncbi:hypothetical protein [Dictyobacter formicarum]|uniref:Uncharacterized protein n=1 Tax=Dictyobacter formicarum TaxID=2778368 RepID=A0ABQ3VFI3_9CHLR|nr:hypothetical protein [Dictyobacter formicarum]GHO84927.1 hypothetical protein KSZ_29330 [Dictyobacter formicarum]
MQAIDPVWQRSPGENGLGLVHVHFRTDQAHMFHPLRVLLEDLAHFATQDYRIADTNESP